MNNDNTTLLCPTCKAVTFICVNEPQMLKDCAQDIAGYLNDGYIPKTMTTAEFRNYEQGFGCKCPKWKQNELFAQPTHTMPAND